LKLFNNDNEQSTPVVLTDVELAQYDGRNASLPIYLGLDGKIYDVTAGRLTYGPGGPYNHFAGKDAVRAFVTGCFDEDSNPDLRGVEWTYVPKDVPRFEEKSDADMTVKEQAYRMEMLEQARRQVAGTVQGWAELFEGRSGKDYFEVGKIQRDEDWAEKEPLKKLCGPAEMSRPRTNFRGNDAGAKYREKKTQ
jgi:predicted heme/steroid binding protein